MPHTSGEEPPAGDPGSVTRRQARARAEAHAWARSRAARRPASRRGVLTGLVAAAGLAGAAGVGTATSAVVQSLLDPAGSAPDPSAVPAPGTTAGTARVTAVSRGASPAGARAAVAPTRAPRAAAPATRTAATLTDAVRVGAADPEHLLRRVTYGATDGLREELERAGIGGWLTRQLAPAGAVGAGDPGGRDVDRLFPELQWSAQRARRTFTDGGQVDRFQRMLGAAHLGRAVWGEQQLGEVLVDVWSNHLNITVPDEKSWESRHLFDRDVIRRHALGRFEDMLLASSEHPAMLAYLDNRDSTGANPNENYARELMELHTVGIDGGYTERDVQQAALLLTGWQVTDGVARYVPSRHHVGAVRVMGFGHPNATAQGGREAAAQFVRWLARRPQTARTVARRLAVRFVADDPPAELVEHLARVYLAGRTAIRPVLVALLGSPEFAASAGAKVRSPFQRLAAAARVLDARPGTDPDGLLDLYWMLDNSGNLPLNWPLPDGYPDEAAAWQSPAVGLNQFNTMISLTHGWWPSKLVLTGNKLLGDVPPRETSQIVDRTAQVVLGRPPTGRERSAATTLLASSGLNLPGDWDRGEAVTLVATLFLNSPAHIAR